MVMFISFHIEKCLARAFISDKKTMLNSMFLVQNVSQKSQFFAIQPLLNAMNPINS